MPTLAERLLLVALDNQAHAEASRRSRPPSPRPAGPLDLRGICLARGVRPEGGAGA
jgi:hypothetical protein